MNRTGLGGPNKASGKVNSLPSKTGQGFLSFFIRRDGNVKGRGEKGPDVPQIGVTFAWFHLKTLINPDDRAGV